MKHNSRRTHALIVSTHDFIVYQRFVSLAEKSLAEMTTFSVVSLLWDHHSASKSWHEFGFEKYAVGTFSGFLYYLAVP